MNRKRRALCRALDEPYAVPLPYGMRVRTRLSVTAADRKVLGSLGRFLGSLASADLVRACRHQDRTARKRLLTAGSTSCWAGAITRASDNLVAAPT